LFRLAHGYILLRQQMANLRSVIIDVSSNDRLLRTNHYTSWLQAYVHSMGAVVTLGDCVAVGIDVNCIVWTSLHTGLATDAYVGIEFYDTVVALVHGLYRADAYARRVCTMVAAGHLKMPARIGIGACFYVLYPGAINSQWDFVLALTGSGTGMTTNALAIIDDEAVILRRGRGINHDS